MKIQTSLLLLSTTTFAAHGAFGQSHTTEQPGATSAPASEKRSLAAGVSTESGLAGSADPQAIPAPAGAVGTEAPAGPSGPQQANAHPPAALAGAPSVVAPAVTGDTTVAGKGQPSAAQPTAAQLDAQLDEEDDDSSHAPTVDGDGPSGRGTAGRFRMMFQLRYRQSHPDAAGLDSQARVAAEQRATVQAQDGYDIQRAFLRYTAQPVKQVEAKMLVDFAELRHGNAKQSFKLAYLQIHATKRLQFDVGLMKRTYSLLELLPIVDHELADLGPTDSFIKDQGYGGRDIGAVVRYSPLPKRRWLTVSAGAFRGDLDEGYDVSPLKLVTARLESYPLKYLRVGLNGAYRPYDNVQMQRVVVDAATGAKDYAEVVTLNPGKAYGADVSLLFKRLQIRAEGLYGDRTQPNRVGSDRFAAGWVVIAPNFELGGVKLVPAAKLERLDLNPAAAGGGRTVLTAVVGVMPVKHLRLITDLTRTVVDPGLLALDKVPFTGGSHVVYVAEPSSTTGTFQVQYQF